MPQLHTCHNFLFLFTQLFFQVISVLSCPSARKIMNAVTLAVRFTLNLDLGFLPRKLFFSRNALQFLKICFYLYNFIEKKKIRKTEKERT